MLKENILSLLSMSDVLNKYNIKENRHMCSCPFHKDKNPSMKIYDKTFYCFSCNRTGDLIQFVQYLFNLSFTDAMKKINYDFNLNLNFNFSKEDKIKFINLQKEIEKQKLQQKNKEEKRRKKFINAANLYLAFERKIKNENKNINYSNWENKTVLIASLQDKMEILNLYMDSLY